MSPRTRFIYALTISICLHLLALITFAGALGGTSGPLKMPGLLLVELIHLSARGAEAGMAEKPTPFPQMDEKAEPEKEPEPMPALTSERKNADQPFPAKKKTVTATRSSAEQRGVNPERADSGASSPIGLEPDPPDDAVTGPGATRGADYYPAEPAVVKAKCASCPSPAYPAMAKRRDIAGDVTVSYEILGDGGVGDVYVVQSSGFPVLDDAAIAAVKSWTFFPGTENGAPVTESRTKTFRFRLD